MRKRLFVDCDDTLILYAKTLWERQHASGFTMGEEYHINEPLVESIKQWVDDNPCALAVIWSGGGAFYARSIADVVLPGVDVVTMVKDQTTFHMVRPGDIVIDDMDIRVPTKVLRPDEWVYSV